ncbi:nucleotide-diphospho-sugar transferase [Polychytrium aggregatum]|uniref:nucleotide-diphospho-sugar transferase n=1 Tax=Polychytrium aggregatum TaxID=110093 RepID=UPI0022FEC312|nr:nucleotide-diphospho-sugar transferase [Polychytrium aggregatum]KAI9197131.1 nucleotide-diphospho-sugar transferase [Polychytrium aggregatum]
MKPLASFRRANSVLSLALAVSVLWLLCFGIPVRKEAQVVASRTRRNGVESSASITHSTYPIARGDEPDILRSTPDSPQTKSQVLNDESRAQHGLSETLPPLLPGRTNPAALVRTLKNQPPPSSPHPFRVPRSNSSIPPYLHQIYFSDLPADSPAWRAISTWTELNPDAIHHIWRELECDSFVRDNFPAIYPSYRRLSRWITRVDFVRYLIVFHFGGTYADVDTECLRPIDDWTDEYPGITAIIGIEMDNSNKQNWRSYGARPIQLCQWTFSSTPQNPILGHLIDRIDAKIRSMSDSELHDIDNVMEIAGPGIFTDSVVLELQGLRVDSASLKGLEEPRVLGSTLLLPTTGFHPTAGLGKFHPMARVNHLFFGSWKENKPQPQP